MRVLTLLGFAHVVRRVLDQEQHHGRGETLDERQVGEQGHHHHDCRTEEKKLDRCLETVAEGGFRVLFGYGRAAGEALRFLSRQSRITL